MMADLCVSILGLVSRLKHIVSNKADKAPSRAGLGYGENLPSIPPLLPEAWADTLAGQ